MFPLQGVLAQMMSHIAMVLYTHTHVIDIHTCGYLCVLNLPPAEINDCWSSTFFFFFSAKKHVGISSICIMHNVLCIMQYTLCIMHYTLCIMQNALCKMQNLCVLCSIYDVMGKHKLLDFYSEVKTEPGNEPTNHSP